MQAQTTRSANTPRVGHTPKALKSIVENWPHSHGTNPDGDTICVPCMSELLLEINDLISIDMARTPDGKLVVT